MIKAISLILILLFFVQSARAQENFRVPRPPAAGAEKLLGDVIYAGMRTPVPRTSFERWRLNYCTPFICNMVLCHGTCGDFAEHCPSFSESGRVIHLEEQGCMVPSKRPAEAVMAGGHCSLNHWLKFWRTCARFRKHMEDLVVYLSRFNDKFVAWIQLSSHDKRTSLALRYFALATRVACAQIF